MPGQRELGVGLDREAHEAVGHLVVWCQVNDSDLGDLTAAGIPLHDAGIRRPTLDDVFLTLTGHRTGPGDEPAAPARTGRQSS